LERVLLRFLTNISHWVGLLIGGKKKWMKTYKFYKLFFVPFFRLSNKILYSFNTHKEKKIIVDIWSFDIPLSTFASFIFFFIRLLHFRSFHYFHFPFRHFPFRCLTQNHFSWIKRMWEIFSARVLKRCVLYPIHWDTLSSNYTWQSSQELNLC
jgi:hypothetical protein